MRSIKRYHFSELPSTNDKAKELSHQYAINEYLAVSADMQTGGRGRNGKVWLGRFGENVYCSLAVRHGATSLKTSSDLASFQVRGALAALQAIRSFLPPLLRPNVMLKYPNDVYAFNRERERKKICGVLVEHEFIGAHCAGSIIGIGINVRQQDFPAEIALKASSLLACGIDVSVEDVTDALLREIEYYLEAPSNALFGEWWRELALEGVSVAVSGSESRWIALRLEEDGSLRVRNADSDEERVLTNGDSLMRLDW